jgi:hypothetical protein
MMPERIDDSSQTPTVLVADWANHLRPCCDGSVEKYLIRLTPDATHERTGPAVILLVASGVSRIKYLNFRSLEMPCHDAPISGLF